MAKQVRIGKVQQMRFATENEKKSYYPVTVDEAVKVKKGNNKYTTLPVALNSKWGDAFVLRVIDDTSTAPNVVYYMFTFAEGKNMDVGSTNKAELRELLSCANHKFKALCAAKGETVRINENYTPLTVSSIENRIAKSEYTSSLFLRKVILHGGSVPTMSVIDENGNEYGDGDTVYFTSYPGKLYLNAKNLDPNYHHDIINLIRDGAGNHFIQLSSVEDEDGIETEMAFNHNVGSLEFTNPFRLPLNWRETTSTDATFFVEAIARGNVYFEIMPTDYPPEDDTVAVAAYTAQTVRGKISINDYIRTLNEGQEVLYPMESGFVPCTLNIVFLPVAEGSSPSFILDNPMPVFIQKQSDWVGNLELKGSYAGAGKTITINASSNTKFVCKKSTDSEYGPFSNIVITQEEITQGITLNIRPADYTENEYYMPSVLNGLPGEYTESIGIVYDNEVSEQTVVTLMIAADAEDFPVIATLEKIASYEDTSSDIYLYYYLIGISNNCPNISVMNSIEYAEIKRFDYAIVNEYSEADDSITDLISELTAQSYTTIQGEINIDVSNIPYILFRVAVIPDTHPTTKMFIGTVLLTDTTNDIRLRLLYTHNYPESTDGPVGGFGGDIGREDGIVATDVTGVTLINRLEGNTNEFKDRMFIQELVNINRLDDGVFSNLTELVDTSFLQYMTRISEIPQYAFYNCSSIETVTLPGNVKKIGKNAFEGCTSLETVVISEGTTEIGDYAFAGCTSLTSITIPNTVTKIGYAAFAGCTSLTSLVIPDSVIYLGKNACSGCTALTSIDIGAGIETLAASFAESTELTDIWLRRCVYDETEQMYLGTVLDSALGLGIGYARRYGLPAGFASDASQLTVHYKSDAATFYTSTYNNNWYNALILDLETNSDSARDISKQATFTAIVETT